MRSCGLFIASQQGKPGSYTKEKVRLRYVPRHPLGFLQTPLLPVAPLPAGYLPAGWAVGFLSTHRLGRHAGHTKTQPPGEPSGCVICVDLAPPSTLDRAAQKSPDEVLLEGEEHDNRHHHGNKGRCRQQVPVLSEGAHQAREAHSQRGHRLVAA